MKKITHLSHKKEIRVRFNDADPMGIVWHGNYIQYMEDARESFGRKFKLDYLGFYAQGYTVPLVKIDIDYKQPLKYGDIAIVEIKLIDSPAAKIIFNYKIYRKSDGVKVAEAKTIQVFLDKNSNELSILIPKFFKEWKKKYLYTDE